MSRTRKPVTWYIATPADGIIEMSRKAGTPVNLAAAVGDVIDFPVKLMCSDSESAVAVRAPSVGSVAGVLVSVPACVPLDAAGIDL